MSLLADWHCMRVEEVLDALGSKREGLSEYEAKSRLEKFGRNVFGRATRRTSLRILFNQFRNLMVFLLAFFFHCLIFIGRSFRCCLYHDCGFGEYCSRVFVGV